MKKTKAVKEMHSKKSRKNSQENSSNIESLLIIVGGFSLITSLKAFAGNSANSENNSFTVHYLMTAPKALTDLHFVVVNHSHIFEASGIWVLEAK